jgi:hypothetical protein
MSDELAEQLLQIGKDLGKVFERKRRTETLVKLKRDLNVAGLKPDDIFNLACTALIASVRGLKEVYFLGAAEVENSKSPMKQAESGNAPTAAIPQLQSSLSKMESSLFESDALYSSTGMSSTKSVSASLMSPSSKPPPQQQQLVATAPNVQFMDVEPLVKKAAMGKLINRSGGLSLAGIASLIVAVDKGFVSLPKKGKRRSEVGLGGELNTSGPATSAAASAPSVGFTQTKSGSIVIHESLPKHRREALISERATADRFVGNCSAVVSIPDGPLAEWVGCEMWLAEGFQFSVSKAKYGQIFPLVLRTCNVSEASAAEDNGYIQEVCNLTSLALHVYWDKELRRKKRKQVSAEIEARLPDLKDLETPDLVERVLEMCSVVLPNVAAYVGVLQKGGLEIAFEGCNRLSKMKGNRLHRASAQGVSFDVINSQVSIHK